MHIYVSGSCGYMCVFLHTYVYPVTVVNVGYHCELSVIRIWDITYVRTTLESGITTVIRTYIHTAM